MGVHHGFRIIKKQPIQKTLIIRDPSNQYYETHCICVYAYASSYKHYSKLDFKKLRNIDSLLKTTYAIN